MIPARLSLHGVTKDIEINAGISRIRKHMRVSSVQSIVINANDFTMVEGIKKLAELAGGIDIVWSVPVNFDLIFTKD